MDALVILIPLLPFAAAILIGIGILSGVLRGEASENKTVIIATWSMSMSFLLALTLLIADLLKKNTGSVFLGNWLCSDTLNIQINFISTGFGVVLATLFALLLVVIMRFSINYMHREIGFHRFFFILSLFASSMLLLVLSGNAVGTFFGWEIAGLCSYLLIAYAYHRPIAVINATRVFVTNRIGDALFILGIAFTYFWVDSINWDDLNAIPSQLDKSEATGIAMCFAIAAFAKSAQLPFTPWLARALEGPTPSSAIFYGAVMVHAGVYLVCLLEPLFEQAPLAMAMLVVVGGITAVYSFMVSLTQTDIKSSLVFATSGQLGLMFLACGLGFWQLASWHLCTHAIVRCYLFLTAPSLMHNLLGNPIKPIVPVISKIRWGYISSLQRLWLDQISDWTLIRPINRLAHDLSYFDDHVIDYIMGSPAPAILTISSIAELEEKRLGSQLDNDIDGFSHGTGLAGKLTEWFAGITHWFEDRFVLRDVNKDAIMYDRKLGHAANKFEELILRPRYLVLFVLIILLIVF